MPPITKEQQLAHYIKRKAQKDAHKKGIQAEKEVAQKLGGRRNHQGRCGGGISNSDVSVLGGWSIEVKNTERLCIPEWLRTLKAECPPNNRPGLVITFEDEQWIAIRLADRLNFAADLIERAGGEVIF